MGIRIEDTDIYEGNIVDLFGHAVEKRYEEKTKKIWWRPDPSYGFFNGCPMVVVKIKTEYSCITVLLRDDRSAELHDERPRFWLCHINQVRKVK